MLDLQRDHSGLCGLLNRLARLAAETKNIISEGFYFVNRSSRDGARFKWFLPSDKEISQVRVFTPEEFKRKSPQAVFDIQNGNGPGGWTEEGCRSASTTRFSVTTESTLEAASRLQHTRPMILNFASAKNRGGGWLRGAKAQEESLCRASTLSASLYNPVAAVYYDANRTCGTTLYTDHAIYSPTVCFFRNDAGELLPLPYTAAVLTMPAPNVGAFKQDWEHAALHETLERRVECVLTAAWLTGHENLVLGAWGCGVFKNEPSQVAEVFYKHLTGPYKGAFSDVTFAILGPENEIHAAFRKVFS